MSEAMVEVPTKSKFLKTAELEDTSKLQRAAQNLR